MCYIRIFFSAIKFEKNLIVGCVWHKLAARKRQLAMSQRVFDCSTSDSNSINRPEEQSRARFHWFPSIILMVEKSG